VFARDSYTCRFCRLKTVDLDVLRALSKLFPAHLPYHRNWKFGLTSLIYWTHATSLEHIVPLARGGVDDPSNYATTCYGCNDARCDLLLEEVGWQLLPPTGEPWDGLRSWLPRLRQVAAGGQPKQD
jgi:5-methylcytosine-specific restriction endonuclease McrA